MNYYIIHPSANSFVVSTGAHAAHSATLIGAASLAAILSNMCHSFVLSKEAEGKKHHTFTVSFFRWPLILSSFGPMIGNVLYAVGVYRLSIPMAVGGRMFVGLGSAEILHRLLVLVHHLPDVEVASESARLVKSQARALTLGLLIGALLESFTIDFNLSDRHYYMPSYASPGILMAFLWLLQWFRMLCLFHEPEDRKAQENHPAHPNAEMQHNDVQGDLNRESDESVDYGASTPESIFFQSSYDEGADDEFEAAYGTNQVLERPTSSKQSDTMVESSPPLLSRDTVDEPCHRRGIVKFAGRLFRVLTYNVALPVTFVLVLLAKFGHEVLFTSCALIGRRYFDASGSLAGLFLGILSALVLPINFFTSTVSQNFEERTVLKRSLLFVIVGLLVMLNWSSLFYIFSRARNLFSEEPWSSEAPPYDWIFGIYQYTIGFVVTFCGLVALEGTTLSLMTKVAPVKLRGSLINCGSIVTFLSLTGKVAGDIQILMVGLSHRLINTDIVNSLVIPLIAICLVAGYVVKKHFFFLI